MIQSPRNSPLFGAIKAAAAAVAAGRSPLRTTAPAPPPSDSTDSSLESFRLDVEGSESQSEPAPEPESPIETLMEDLKTQMASLDDISRGVRRQMKSICTRAKEEADAEADVDATGSDPVAWLERPLSPRTTAFRQWLQARSLPAQPSLSAFFDACLTAANTADFESRTLTFTKEDAIILWKGEQRLTIFDILARLPKLFE